MIVNLNKIALLVIFLIALSSSLVSASYDECDVVSRMKARNVSDADVAKILCVNKLLLRETKPDEKLWWCGETQAYGVCNVTCASVREGIIVDKNYECTEKILSEPVVRKASEAFCKENFEEKTKKCLEETKAFDELVNSVPESQKNTSEVVTTPKARSETTPTSSVPNHTNITSTASPPTNSSQASSTPPLSSSTAPNILKPERFHEPDNSHMSFWFISLGLFIIVVVVVAIFVKRSKLRYRSFNSAPSADLDFENSLLS
jgi:cobalamin biosynthesis Mg chelatase CobN